MEILNSSGRNSSLTYKKSIIDSLNSGKLRWSDLQEKDKETVVMYFVPKINCIVQRFVDRLPNSIEKEDLISAATIGLLEALKNFNSKLKTKLETYVDYRIKGAILDELRKQDFFSRGFRKKVKIVEELKERFSKTGNESISIEELHKLTGFDKKELIKILEVSENTLWIPLEDLKNYYIFQKEKLTETEPLTAVIKEELVEKVSKLIDELNENEKLVLSLYYEEELTMKEVAKVLNLSEGRVSQIHKQAIQKLRKRIKHILEE